MFLRGRLNQAVLLLMAIFSCQFVDAQDPTLLPYNDSAMIEMQAAEGSVRRQETRQGIYAPGLYKPLRILGTLQLKYGLFDEAIDTFRRMQHITHRQYGVNTERQLESIDLLVSGLAAKNDFLAVDTQQHFQYRLANQAFEATDPRKIAVDLKLADWYRSTGRHSRALNLYSEARDSLTSINPQVEIRILRSEALTNYLAGRCCAADQLSKALEIVMANPAEVTMETTSAVDDLNDMMSLEERNPHVEIPQKNQMPKLLGFRSERDVLKLMSLTHSRGYLSDIYFNLGEREPGEPGIPTVGNPVSMCGTTFSQLVVADRDHLEVDVTLTINAHGRPARIDISGAAPSRLKRYLKDSLKAARYRTATDDTGHLVASELSFRQSFTEQSLDVTSRSPTDAWSKMLVAQTCQMTGVQRI